MIRSVAAPVIFYGMGRDSIPGIGVVDLDLALAKRTRFPLLDK